MHKHVATDRGKDSVIPNDIPYACGFVFMYLTFFVLVTFSKH